MSRYESLTKLLGEGAVERVRKAKVLLVGAGGIGCELLKELVLAGFGEIHLIDLDTIDLSNLNRQFLFTKQHVKQSKAKVAAEVASQFNKDVRVVPYVANIITTPEFTHKWFGSFDLVFNALDNAEARRHVNRMCVASKVPLIDCGSAGFAGQVQVILPGSECFDCRTHDAPKAFPVCTIRSTPSQPIHCVVWAKSFLFSLLFAPQEEEEDAGTEAGEGENRDEIAKLNAEANELVDLKHSLRQPDFLSRLVSKVYVADIERLLLASNLWKGNPQAPKPLQLDPKDFEPLNPADLDEHTVWTPEQSMGVLKFVVKKLINRLDNGEPAIEFDKDDEDTLDFVVAATVLRSAIFNIPQRTKFQIKQMAGNIIPAVATTNAIVGGLGVLEAFKLMAGMRTSVRSVNILRHDNTVLIGDKLYPPNPECVVSNAARTTARAPPSATLASLISTIVQEKLGYDEVSLVTDKLIYDPDFEDQAEKTLEELGLVDRFVTVVDEDDRRVNLEVYIEPAKEMTVDDTHVPLKPEVKRPREDDAEDNVGDEDLNGDANEIDDGEIEIVE